ncbi:MAG TPA: response regulator [Candidatus Sulfotelmatobacter sp.]|jgi:CheY-like chemotaxis protein|nr:response regulator [Candidatus Sulfotelmatobacter sp.]
MTERGKLIHNIVENVIFEPNGHMALVADDEPLSLMVMAEILEKIGYLVITASHGREVVDLAQQHTVSVIITDIDMPIMDGLEASQAIRVLGGRLTAIPIIAVTARNDLDPGAVKEAGIDMLFQKGADLSSLFDVLAEIAALPRPSVAI